MVFQLEEIQEDLHTCYVPLVESIWKKLFTWIFFNLFIERSSCSQSFLVHSTGLLSLLLWVSDKYHLSPRIVWGVVRNLVKWHKVCYRNCGALGVRLLCEFNFILLGKWCWRFQIDKIGLWFKVLPATYDFVNEEILCWANSCLLWLKNIKSILKWKFVD